jgi:hypothetical protein
MYLYGSPG